MQQTPQRLRFLILTSSIALAAISLVAALPAWSVQKQRVRPDLRRVKLFAAIRDSNATAFTEAASSARAALPNLSGITALQWASFKGNSARAEALLKKGARLNESTSFGTALTAALRGGQKKTALLLLKRGAVSAKSGERGITDLMLAAANDMPEVLSTLSRAKNLSETDYLGENALFYAARSGPACIKPLIRMGALISATNLHGNTPLMEAVAANIAEVRWWRTRRSWWR